MAAAAAVVVLAGFAVAHTRGAFSAPEPTQTVDASSGGSQLGADDGAGDRGDDEVTASGPQVTDPPVTEPPVTEPPVTEPPATEPDDRRDHDHGDGYRDHDDGWGWADGDWEPHHTERGVEFDPDGEGGRPPIVFEHEWWERCDGEPGCLWHEWFEANGSGGPDPDDGPTVYSQPGP
jgi:hypothetical protein